MSKVTKSSGCVFNDLNVSHPTPCDELVTVATQVRLIGDDHFRPFKPLLGEKLVEETRELVTRQNAEEVIAAKDARIDEYETGLVQMHQEMSALESDNKRLREEIAALREALEYFLVAYEEGYNLHGAAIEARAVLGGKP